jgi:hypothetical protein
LRTAVVLAFRQLLRCRELAQSDVESRTFLGGGMHTTLAVALVVAWLFPIVSIDLRSTRRVLLFVLIALCVAMLTTIARRSDSS